MSVDSTRRSSRRKSSTLRKPRPDFPLSIHKGTGYWCKKVRGKVHYFGKIDDDPKGVAALDVWLEQKDDLIAGREPRTQTGELTVADLANAFLSRKEHLRENGELSPRTFQGYHATCATIVKQFGKNRIVTMLVPDDFHKLRVKLAKTRKAVALRNEIQRVRSVFKFAFDEVLILAPIRFGQAFDKPKLDIVRRTREAKRAEHGDRMFEASEIRQILNSAKQPMGAMVLLAANCGFGQTDLSSLPTRAINLETGWVDFSRPKTGVPRRIPLWPETIEAVREWLPQRPKAKDANDARLLFLTCRGSRWVKVNKDGYHNDALGQEFVKLLRKLELKRMGVSFYALRHTLETIAGESRDQVAVNAVMGHVDSTMASAYRERISNERLRAVVETVRQWLFDDTDDDTTEPTRKTLAISDPIDPCDPKMKPVNDAGPSLRLFVG